MKPGEFKESFDDEPIEPHKADLPQKWMTHRKEDYVRPLVAGVLGHPIQHSLSPEIFQFISSQLGHPVFYERLSVAPADLGKFLSFLKKLPLLQGMNVTLPYKEKVISKLNRISPEAKSIGAVNVVKIKDGQLIGYNTDVLGIENTLLEQGFQLKNGSAALIGAGGAALSVGYVLGRGGAEYVSIFNRNPLRAKKVAKKLSQLFPQTFFQGFPLKEVLAFERSVDLYVNSTPLGMKGFPRTSVLPKKVSSHALAFDLVYRPEETPFLKDARKRGLRIVGGLDMLVWQALAAWEIWVGPVDDPHALKSQLAIHLRSILRKEKKG